MKINQWPQATILLMLAALFVEPRSVAAVSETTGSIAGKVTIEGAFPRPAPLIVNKNQDFCGKEVPNESLLVNADRGIKNVALVLHGTGKEKKKNTRQLVLDNKNCAFVPHVQVGQPGDNLLLLNSDPILHDAHARIGTETLFNVGIPAWRKVTQKLTRPGVITFGCEVLHTWMSAYIIVTRSPFFAVTNAQGEFLIGEVPPATYELGAWHERLGSQSKEVTVHPGSVSRLNFTFRCVSC